MSELRSRKTTVEFRQHIGTLEPTTAVSFIDVLVNLVLYCQGITDGDFEARREGEFSNPDFTTLELCKLIGCHEDTVEHYRTMFRAEKNAFAAHLDQLEKDAEKAKTKDFPLSFFALEQAKWLRLEADPKIVEKQINKKLLAGGYGQFDPEYLTHILPKQTDPEVAPDCTGVRIVPFFKKVRLERPSSLSIHLLICSTDYLQSPPVLRRPGSHRPLPNPNKLPVPSSSHAKALKKNNWQTRKGNLELENLP